MSLITSDPEVLEIMATMNRAHLAFKATGASLFGPNFGEWPPWASEALLAIEQERALVDSALIEAQNADARAAARRNQAK